MRAATTPTTAHSLGALLKSARDIMSKDKGLNGDLDRLLLLTWIMFLKFLDDLELQREGNGSWLPRRNRHLTDRPHPQPLSHPMGEGSVGLSSFEAERE